MDLQIRDRAKGDDEMVSRMESTDELLSRHSELLADGRVAHATALRLATEDASERNLLDLADRIHHVLRPVQPSRSYVKRLQRGLVAAASNRVPTRLKLRRALSSRCSTLVHKPRAIKMTRGRTAPRRGRLSTVFLQGAAVALITVATVLWLER